MLGLSNDLPRDRTPFNAYGFGAIAADKAAMLGRLFADRMVWNCPMMDAVGKNALNLTDGRRLTISDDSNGVRTGWRPTPYGFGWFSNENYAVDGNKKLEISGTRITPDATNGWTVLQVFWQTAVTPDSTIKLWSQDFTPSYYQRVGATTAWKLDTFCYNRPVLTASNEINHPGLNVVISVFATDYQACCVNGVITEDTTSGAWTTAGNVNTTNVWGQSIGVSFYNSMANMLLGFASWARRLSKPEMLFLAQNPFILWQHEPAHVPLFVAAGGGGFLPAWARQSNIGHGFDAAA